MKEKHNQLSVQIFKQENARLVASRRVAMFLTLVGQTKRRRGPGAHLRALGGGSGALVFLAVSLLQEGSHGYIYNTIFHSSSLKHLLDNMNKVNFIAK